MNIQTIMEHIESGGVAYIPTYKGAIKIDQKVVNRFRKAGYEVLRQDDDGRGFRLQQGKSANYVFNTQIVLR